MEEEKGTNGTRAVGNTSARVRGRRWCFTLNNWCIMDLGTIIRYFGDMPYIIGEEKGASGTPHLQGYIEFEHPRDFEALKKLSPRAHWEKAKGNQASNVKYCSKENVISSNKLTLPARVQVLEQYKSVVWKNWQQDIINIVESPRNERIINWIWEPRGATGKTFLARYLFCRYRTCLASGKRGDVYYSIKSFIDNNHYEPDLIICDIPRSIEERFISYTCLEQIKDRLFKCTKYESEDILFIQSPHIIVFANHPPDKDKMSLDRWNVLDLGYSGAEVSGGATAPPNGGRALPETRASAPA